MRMKFGKYLRDQAFPEWRFYYVDYEGLKRLLRERQEGEAISEAEEAAFVDTLEKEIQKVPRRGPQSPVPIGLTG